MIPDDILTKYLSPSEVKAFNNDGVGGSITVYGEKEVAKQQKPKVNLSEIQAANACTQIADAVKPVGVIKKTTVNFSYLLAAKIGAVIKYNNDHSKSNKSRFRYNFRTFISGNGGYSL